MVVPRVTLDSSFILGFFHNQGHREKLFVRWGTYWLDSVLLDERLLPFVFLCSLLQVKVGSDVGVHLLVQVNEILWLDWMRNCPRNIAAARCFVWIQLFDYLQIYFWTWGIFFSVFTIYLLIHFFNSKSLMWQDVVDSSFEYVFAICLVYAFNTVSWPRA